MKRIFLFLVTNIAAVALLTFVTYLVCGFCGVDITRLAGEGGYGTLLVMSFAMGMLGSLISLFMSKTMVKRSMKCKTITGDEGETERWLVDTVADLARRANLKMPEVAIYPGAANAFATGAFKNSALVAVSTDIMTQMSREELRAVLGHEMSHVRNGDMVTLSLTQGVINTFVIFFAHIIASVVQNTLSGRNGRNSESHGLRRGGTAGYAIYHLFVYLCQLVFGIFASIVVMWYSRRREFAADAGSAELLGSPSPMISALRRLGSLTPGKLPDSMKAFGISAPKSLMSLFASHPPLEDRINALMNLPPAYVV